ncbi:beta-lactamase [Candidatus Magnetomorum sp. HK-1]|nr:beta-lactamase [Candidatus Magnetomorum sp. HK-1]
MIFDAGTGLRKFGQALIDIENLETIKGSLFLSHTHWDHIQGLPFFLPTFLKDNRFIIYGERKKGISLEEILAEQMQGPFFPLEMDAFQADIDFHEVETNKKIEIREDIHVTPFRLTHPNAAIGYLLQIEDIRLAYVTDHEHKVHQLSTNVLEMVQGVDVLIHDAQYSRKEIENGKKGWGHSAWEDVIDLAIDAKVGQLFLYHHDPEIITKLYIMFLIVPTIKYVYFCNIYFYKITNRIENQITSDLKNYGTDKEIINRFLKYLYNPVNISREQLNKMENIHFVPTYNYDKEDKIINYDNVASYKNLQ